MFVFQDYVVERCCWKERQAMVARGHAPGTNYLYLYLCTFSTWWFWSVVGLFHIFVFRFYDSACGEFIGGVRRVLSWECACMDRTYVAWNPSLFV